MKIGWKLIALWIASLTLFTGAGIVALVAPEMMRGIHGLAIRFFLGYCGIVVVAQALTVMTAIQRLRNDATNHSRKLCAIKPAGSVDSSNKKRMETIMRIKMNPLRSALVLLVATCIVPALAIGLESGDCLSCHSDASTVGKTFVVTPSTFDTTAHAGLGCPACHESVTKNHPDDGLAPSKASCPDCHAAVVSEYAVSAHHGKAVCNDCHNPHQARGATAVSGHDMNQQCSQCHAAADIATQHDTWLPQAELHLGMLPCISCHTASKDNVITLYIVKGQKTASRDFEPASYAELNALAKGKSIQTLIDGNEDNYISLAELRLFNLNPANNPLRLQGMMTPETVTHDFKILANRRDCSFCHASGPGARQTSFLSLAQSDGSFQRIPIEKGAVLDALHGTPDFYMVGSTRSTVMNYIGAAIIAGGLLMPIGHGTLRFLTRKNRKHEGSTDHE